MTTIQEYLTEIEIQSQNYASQHWCAYAAEHLYLSDLTHDMDEEEMQAEYEGQADEYVDYMEGLLPEVIHEIYEDWYQSEANIYHDENGLWPKGTSQYQWHVWAIVGNCDAYFHEKMVEYAESEGLELPQWYKDEYMD